MTTKEIAYLKELLNALKTIPSKTYDEMVESINYAETISDQLRKDLLEIANLVKNSGECEEVKQIQFELSSVNYEYQLERSLLISLQESFNEQRASILKFLSVWVYVYQNWDHSRFCLERSLKFDPETHEIVIRFMSWQWFEVMPSPTPYKMMSKYEFKLLRFSPMALQNLFDDDHDGCTLITREEDRFWASLLFGMKPLYPALLTTVRHSADKGTEIYDYNFNVLGKTFRHELRETVLLQEASPERQVEIDEMLNELNLNHKVSKSLIMNRSLTSLEGYKQIIDFLLTFAYVIKQFKNNLSVHSTFDPETLTLDVIIEESK